MFKILVKEVETSYGKEIVITKKHNLFKDQWKDRIWVFQPQDKEFIAISNKLRKAGLWN